MAYTPKTWANGAGGGTPITAAELNRIEQGVDVAHDEISDMQDVISGLADRIAALEAQ
ncbi:hypothetical protein SEA_ZIRINKA_13 [Gordonia phage Zirinka]|uniref:Uncharacterized protein n=2 Tax=Nymphadoravirus zirinka TaxID=2170042 RepID=A0A1B3B1W6_9CAUD|nr:hypothetical protein SEA_ZIRINKA_13 [Gordonia phage Zirinka]AOE45015.1 hypothetical protein SEA_ZIRINKA_13 [Gordonia phage Zirinka]AYQ99155.1 hypothetical protein PBI_BIALOTA_13 [Gordonia phage Bialota]